ncbi:cytochrome b [Neptuniibacter sp. 1_MG-2023]|jgi:cytochrome b561|uniref:cytochrome b n=1 Tax=Neptuniibacter sp. 1_MG-2023 TaxID=3062662 RepID=UPI0026E21201|nr:cytochrome b [Neptuniibacter sp. 1_MG-2023]MDO6593960.1 cytochrome b [Neptuniibacter sp. 1_MG-2023]
MVFNHKLTNDETSYGWGPVFMHWLMAFAIIGLYPLGWYIETLDYYDPAYKTVPVWHKSIGILVAMTLLLRIVWRIFNKPPAALPQPAPLLFIAKMAHGLLYLLVLLTVISGYLISTADGRAIELFNLISLPALPFEIDNQEDIAGEIHFIVATSLISIAALHAAAALKHHFIDKDTTLKRMLALREETE